MSENRFPLFIDLSDKTAAVVGGGVIGRRRVDTLLKFTKNIFLFDPDPKEELIKYEKKIDIVPFVPGAKDLVGFDMVLLCTDDHNYNHTVYDALEGRCSMRNCCDDHMRCDFFFPSVVTESHMTVGINGSGKDHGGTKRLRQRIEAMMTGRAE